MGEVIGPLLRLERDAGRPGDRWPHRIVRPDGPAICWATDAEAADFQARYWTGDLPRPTPPAARVLPEGVHEAPDGTLLWKCERDGFKAYPERVTPPGYAAWLGIDNVSQGAMPGRWYEVRPIPDPEPEPVPHTESIGRVTTESPYPVTSYHGHADGGRWVLCDSVNADGVKNGWDRVNADSSGMVSCLPITDGDDRDLPAPDPRSPEDGAGAPTPFETFQAGMFAGIMAERVAGRDPQDWTEGEVRREFRDWLEERAAATPANGATR